MIGNRDIFTVHVPELAPLAWLAFGVEAGAAWWFGRGVFALTVQRLRRLPGESVVVYLQPGPDTQPRAPMRWSAATIIHDIPAFPHRLLHPVTTDPLRQILLVEMRELRAETNLASLAYHFADCVADMFKLGAVQVWGQWSRTHCQIYSHIGLDAPTFRDFADPHVPNYTSGEHVGSLPWPAQPEKP